MFSKKQVEILLQCVYSVLEHYGNDCTMDADLNELLGILELDDDIYNDGYRTVEGYNFDNAPKYLRPIAQELVKALSIKNDLGESHPKYYLLDGFSLFTLMLGYLAHEACNYDTGEIAPLDTVYKRMKSELVEVPFRLLAEAHDFKAYEVKDVYEMEKKR